MLNLLITITLLAIVFLVSSLIYYTSSILAIQASLPFTIVGSCVSISLIILAGLAINDLLNKLDELDKD